MRRWIEHTDHLSIETKPHDQTKQKHNSKQTKVLSSLIKRTYKISWKDGNRLIWSKEKLIYTYNKNRCWLGSLCLNLFSGSLRHGKKRSSFLHQPQHTYRSLRRKPVKWNKTVANEYHEMIDVRLDVVEHMEVHVFALIRVKIDYKWNIRKWNDCNRYVSENKQREKIVWKHKMSLLLMIRIWFTLRSAFTILLMLFFGEKHAKMTPSTYPPPPHTHTSRQAIQLKMFDAKPNPNNMTINHRKKCKCKEKEEEEEEEESEERNIKHDSYTHFYCFFLCLFIQSFFYCIRWWFQYRSDTRRKETITRIKHTS